MSAGDLRVSVEHVSIQLDLEAEFHFTHLIMTFKTFRPAAMLVERSADFGRSWKVYRYFAYDCATAFPHIPRGPPRRIDDVICESRYSDIEPSTEGEVIYRVLDPSIPIRDPYSPSIQRCQCDPRGTVPEGSRCDPISGECFCTRLGSGRNCTPSECFCKRLVTGRNCNQCLPEHWGLSHDLPGCRPCDCDVGGARDNSCIVETGQCQCRSHVVGRQCGQVEPGFYRINLDHYTYEAEDARLHQGSVVERELPTDHPASWTGTGFARMLEGGWVEFHVNNVPFSTEYDVIIRYEPQHPEPWQEVRVRVVVPSPVSASSPCGNTIPADDQLSTSLPSGARYVVLPQPVCLERGVSYTIRLELGCATTRQDPTASVLIDSLVLLPQYSSLEMFIAGDPGSMERRKTFERYRCAQPFHAAGPSPVAEPCSSLLHSLSAGLHEGGLHPLQPGGRCLPCQCHDNIDMTDPEACDRRTGHCLRCLYNTAGPHCAECQPGYYGDATRHSCRRCSCNMLGTDPSTCGPQQCQCDVRSGRAPCLPHVEGQSCDRCSPNFWNLGSGQGCQPCACHPQHALTPACNQVAEAKGKADEARLRAQAALDKANQTRARVESSNKELRELISHVKAFLSRPRPHGAGTLAMPVAHATGPQMQAQTVSTEQQLVGAMERIGVLDGQTDALKVKRANNSLAATRAQEAASAARDRASEAKQVLEGLLRDHYRTAQELVQHRAQGVQQAGSRAQQLRDEAAGLLQDAQSKLQRLRALEEAYERNERGKPLQTRERYWVQGEGGFSAFTASTDLKQDRFQLVVPALLYRSHEHPRAKPESETETSPWASSSQTL
ncbi:PREDICTED: laminin subunit beta-2-like [Charadrius vociferus]|uniref:laminin subunit beta-2-like n=1 Tax=Charadrius vociferus TaxID=50402 RepID=UPI000521A91A|nr:PREDICTED: laminin subunit beta-2-like [Charadrius vociferus]